MLVQGPAGCCKTTLALQWRAQAVGHGQDVAWLTVAPGDDSESLLDNLFACLDGVDPAIAREAAFLYNRDNDSRHPEPMAIALLRGLAGHSRDILLLIDDYHLIADARAHQLVQMLLDFALPHLHLAFLTRAAPPLSLARLRDNGALLEFDFRDLRFSFSEAEALPRSQHADLRKGDARILYDLTDGWVAGLRLVALTLRSGPPGAALRARDPVQNARDFSAYFEREVLCRLPAADVQAMACLAAAARFNQPLYAALLGADRSQAVLGRLLRDNLFLTLEAGSGRDSGPAGGNGADREGDRDGGRDGGRDAGRDGGREPWYRFHPLFRELLAKRFDALPAAERQRTHALLSTWFGRRLWLREAVHHGVAAGAFDEAADWLGQQAQALFLRGDLRRLVRAVAELPRAVTRGRTSLRLWVAWSQWCYRQLGACRETLAELKATISAADAARHNHLTLLEGSLAIQTDDTQAAERLLPAVAAMAPARDAILVGGRRNMLGWFHLQRLDFERARQGLSGPRQTLDNGQVLLDSAFGALVGDGLRGLSHFREGDMRQAERLLRETLREAEATLGPYCEGAVNAAALLSPVLYEIGDLDGLRALLDPRMGLIERVGLPDAVVYASIARCRLLRREGSLHEALAEIERLDDLAKRRQLDRLLSFALAERMAVHLALGDDPGAQDALALLRFAAQRQAARTSAAALEVGWRADSARAQWLASRGRDQDALDTLQALLVGGGFSAQRRLCTQLVARIALLQGRLGRDDVALDGMVDAWQQAQRLGLVRSLLDLGDDALAWGERAAGAGRLDAAACFHVERVRRHAGAPATPVAPAAAAAAYEPLSERDIAIVRALAAALPNKRIGQALGISPETVKWHLKNVYTKLGVYGRDGAVLRAQGLGYLDAGPA